MKKKYTLQIVNFQIKSYYQFIFKILKKNFKASNYKLICFNRLKKACQKTRSKIFMFQNFVSKSFQIKYCLHILKNNSHLLSSHSKTNANSALAFSYHQKKHTYSTFFKIMMEKHLIKTLSDQYNICFVQKMYIAFFKLILLKRGEKEKRQKKLKDAEEIYLYNLARKAIRNLYLNKKISIMAQTIQLRKYVIGKMFFTNLNELHQYIQNLSFYYRNLHLKKYYFLRLRRTSKKVRLNRLAKIKKQKEKEEANKKRKLEGTVYITKILQLVEQTRLIKNATFFYFKLQQHYKNVLNQEILSIKLHSLQKKMYYKKKFLMFKVLHYNKNISRFFRIITFILSRRSLFKLQRFYYYCEKKDKKKGSEYRLILLYRKIKLLFPYMKIRLKRKKLLKRNIFDLLLFHLSKVQCENSNLVQRFRKYYLLFNFFKMLKLNYLIGYRENTLLKKAEVMIHFHQQNYLYWGFKSIKMNWLCNRFINKKLLKLKIKVFYGLKMMSH